MHHKKLVIRTDVQPAMTNIMNKVQELLPDWVKMERGLKYSNQSNGAAEREIRAVRDQIRKPKLNLDACGGVKTSAGDTVWPWLVRHAAYLLSRYMVGSHGKTA